MSNFFEDELNPIDAVISQLDEDAGAIFEKGIIHALQQVKNENHAEFARIRNKIKQSKKVPMSEFDRVMKLDSEISNDQDGGLGFNVELWPDPVDGVELLDEISNTLKKYVIADNPTIYAASLWVVFTWLIDEVSFAPIANITAPEKRCGKSVLLRCLGKLSYQPLMTSNIRPAALFRAIEKWSPTLLIDEVDTFLRENEEARGIINSGFEREMAYVIRCVGDNHEPTSFCVWGAKALCGIGKIADTLADRSIPLRLRRKKTNERTGRLSKSSDELWDSLRKKIARFVEDNREQVKSSQPDVIEGLNDRANDCWEPLLQIASVVGDAWLIKAHSAAVSLNDVDQEAPSIKIELLSDIRDIFNRTGHKECFSSEMLSYLTFDPETRWSTYNRGKPITPRQLGVKLSDFNIKSKTVRRGSETKKGYQKSQFIDAFERYLSTGSVNHSVTSSQVSNNKCVSDIDVVTIHDDVSLNNSSNSTVHQGCDDVTVKAHPISFM